ncbi:MAG: hypothetical protein JOY87_06780 [Candidatus Eremiobacteraeota bacterium]|nr:hypothetical protein [Candidatus Eremiobacteraeota bacterium]MBV8358966.1 hypothetical protein [Deltaproteobacteria bacterium]
MPHGCRTEVHRQPTCCGRATERNVKVKTRTLANLSHWPLAKIERLRRVLRDEALSAPEQELTLLRSLPHGHVAAALGTARKIGLDRLLAGGQEPPHMMALVLAMIIARVIDPASKLATARQLDATTATSSLGALLAQLAQVGVALAYFRRGGSNQINWLGGMRSRFERVVTTLGIFCGMAVGSDGACICAIRFARKMGRFTAIGAWCEAFASVDGWCNRR